MVGIIAVIILVAIGVSKYRQGKVQIPFDSTYVQGEELASIYSELDDKEIKDINWPNDCLVVSIYRGEKEILPKGDTKIYAGDLLVIMTNAFFLF